jgi:hypothetical protein
MGEPLHQHADTADRLLSNRSTDLSLQQHAEITDQFYLNKPAILS